MTRGLISVVDDDESIRRTTTFLIESFGFRAAAFESAENFLKSGQLHDTSCLIVDVQMPGMNGLELQSELAAAGYDIPIIFITAYDNKVSRQQAMQAELARVSRLTTMGELAASIAHEVNQPLTAVINNGSACLKFSPRITLNLRFCVRALEERKFIAYGTGAEHRFRLGSAAFIKKEPAEKSELDINEVIQEVLVLVAVSFMRIKSCLTTESKTSLPSALADRVRTCSRSC